MATLRLGDIAPDFKEIRQWEKLIPWLGFLGCFVSHPC
jgi:hypothetical protein